MIVCLRTVAVPDTERDRFLAWIAENRAVREEHGICAEVVVEPTTPTSIAPSSFSRSRATTSSAATSTSMAWHPPA
jgi:hypothetical protein